MEIDSNKSDNILREMEETAKRKFLPIVGPEKGKIIIDVIRQFKPKNILEIGTLLGYSAILIGKELSGDARLTTIEMDREEAETARENMQRAGILPNVDILVGDALMILPTLKGEFDLVFFDAAKEENMEYLTLIEKKLHRQSVLLADNAGLLADKMEDYLNYVRTSGKYKSKYFSVGQDGLEISVKI